MFLEALVTAIALVIGTLIYNVTLHPLAKVPGPKLWGASRLPWVYYMSTGKLMHRVTALHKQYGHAVRIAPNEISFTGTEAFQEIHGYRPGIRQFPKNPMWHEEPKEARSASIMNANNEDHTRIRKVLNSVFSMQNISKMEPMLQFYISKMVSKLGDKAGTDKAHNAVNMVSFLNFVTFDIVGELTFHESFGCLDADQLHPWIAVTFSYFKAVCIIACARFYPPLEKILMSLQSSKSVNEQQKHSQRTTEAIQRRQEKKSFSQHEDFPDFFSAFQQALDSGDIDMKEVNATTVNLILGGSETIASTLSGTINYLVRYPDVLKTATAEVRNACGSDGHLTADGAEKLEYLNAVIKEGLRLTPPIPCGVPRTAPPGGAVIYGYHLPAKTMVSVHHYATYRSPQIWADPERFAPERWLESATAPGSKYANDDRNALKIFSLGPRRCLGERLAWVEMRLLLGSILLNFDMSAAGDEHGDDSKPIPHWEDQETYALWTREPYFVHVQPPA